ncbi:hypothetical protein JYU09_00750 [bacterium AH-315-O15]|nr:hypothetical protein [bacterium AH-315-O15]
MNCQQISAGASRLRVEPHPLTPSLTHSAIENGVDPSQGVAQRSRAGFPYNQPVPGFSRRESGFVPGEKETFA